MTNDITIESQFNYLVDCISNMDDCQKEFHFDIDTSRLQNLNHIQYDDELRRQIKSKTMFAMLENKV